jgi:hypothetical protein
MDWGTFIVDNLRLETKVIHKLSTEKCQLEKHRRQREKKKLDQISPYPQRLLIILYNRFKLK